MTKKRKIGLVLIAICLVLCVAVGSSYAIWKVTNKQTTANNFQSCFQLNYVEDSDAIALDNAFPETDANGLKEKPFTFTLTNVCENEVYYQINLETLLEPTAATTLQDSDLKVAINKKDYTTNSPKLLSDYDRVTTTGLVENAKRAYKIETGALPAHGEITYNVWEYINDTSKNSDVTNKEHKSKISIIYTSDEKDRNTYLYNAPETCFNFDVASGEIVGYYSHEENDPSKDACPMNVVVPSTIDGHTVTKLGGYLFAGLGFTAVEIPNTITTIGEYALANNALTDLVIPDSVTYIGANSFFNNKIDNLTISSNATYIGDRAFRDNKLTTVTIPEGITDITFECFMSNDLQTISLPSTLKHIGVSAFAYNELQALTIPAAVNNIEVIAFNDNRLPDDQAFIYKRNADGTIDNKVVVGYGGAKRDGVVIPEGIETIFNYAFAYNHIQSVTLPSTLKNIYVGAFNLNDLTHITIPPSVTYIHGNTFNINKLVESEAFIYGRNPDGTPNGTIVSYGGTGGNVTIPTGTTGIGEKAFYASNITSVTIPNTVTNIGVGAFTGNKLPDNQAFIYNRNSDGTINYASLNSYGGEKRDNITIPTTVSGINLTQIGPMAFEEGYISGTLNIPPTVQEIGYWAFHYNLITDLVIPDSVTFIDWASFSEGTITNLTLGNSITSIGEKAFYSNNIGSVTIPATTTTINNEAFYVNPLTEVKIKGKSSTSDFTAFGTDVFTWKAGYSDANIEWNAS